MTNFYTHGSYRTIPTADMDDRLEGLEREARGSWCDSCRDIGVEAVDIACLLLAALNEAEKAIADLEAQHTCVICESRRVHHVCDSGCKVEHTVAEKNTLQEAQNSNSLGGKVYGLIAWAAESERRIVKLEGALLVIHEGRKNT